TFTCSVRGGSPSSASPAGTTTTSGSTIVGTLLTRAGEYAVGGVRRRGSTHAGDATHSRGRCCEDAAVRAYGHDQSRLSRDLDSKARGDDADAAGGGRAGQRHAARRL